MAIRVCRGAGPRRRARRRRAAADTQRRVVASTSATPTTSRPVGRIARAGRPAPWESNRWRDEDLAIPPLLLEAGAQALANLQAAARQRGHTAAAESLADFQLDNLVVNRYFKGEGIGAHRDRRGATQGDRRHAGHGAGDDADDALPPRRGRATRSTSSRRRARPTTFGIAATPTTPPRACRRPPPPSSTRSPRPKRVPPSAQTPCA